MLRPRVIPILLSTLFVFQSLSDGLSVLRAVSQLCPKSVSDCLLDQDYCTCNDNTHSLVVVARTHRHHALV
ncbi:MAG: hypothetical protein K2Y08_07595 [Alphaproteobacteria bacterium]|nr:hypothetical protein [Alphaproteobacteria bacterium]